MPRNATPKSYFREHLEEPCPIHGYRDLDVTGWTQARPPLVLVPIHLNTAELADLWVDGGRHREGVVQLFAVRVLSQVQLHSLQHNVKASRSPWKSLDALVERTVPGQS